MNEISVKISSKRDSSNVSSLSLSNCFIILGYLHVSGFCVEKDLLKRHYLSMHHRCDISKIVSIESLRKKIWTISQQPIIIGEKDNDMKISNDTANQQHWKKSKNIIEYSLHDAM